MRILALLTLSFASSGWVSAEASARSVDYVALIRSAHCEHADTNLIIPCSIVDLTAGNTVKADSEMTAYSSAIHPDVVNVPGGWNGHAYWISYSPYPHLVTGMGNENPHVACSDDGRQWTTLVGPGRHDIIPNPLDTRDRSKRYSYLSDPDLLLDTDSTLWLLYRGRIGTDNDTIFLRARRSRDGINWTDPQTILSGESQPDLRHPEGGLSPSLLKIDSLYHLWNVDAQTSPSIIRHFTSESMFGEWKLSDSTDLGAQRPVKTDLWHINVIGCPDGTLAGLFTFTDSGTTGHHCRLAIASSSDTGSSWIINPDWLLSGARDRTAWDSDQIYRAGGYWDFEKDQPVLRLYYSAMHQGKVPIWGTGLTTVFFDWK